jgi:diguanylate cyclase (GGDEF)-like protein
MRHNISLFERVRENEQLAEKFYQVELKILATLNYADLFETLLNEVATVFDVPLVWFSLIDDNEVAGLLRERYGRQLATVVNSVKRESLERFIGTNEEVVRVNENLHHYLSLLPKKHYQVVRSMALAPIVVDGELVGTLNQASDDDQRFSPSLNPVLLQRLALIISICLSNVTAHEKLSGLASLDPLTGLFNRRVLEQVLQREYARAVRYAVPLAVVFIDLNDFKIVNDTYGHAAGDLLLQHLATHLKDLSRSSDFVARFAGDEFVLILPETDSIKAAKLLQRMVDVVHNKPLTTDTGELLLSLSYGIAALPDPEITTHEQLLKKADQCLYRTKRCHKQGRQLNLTPQS